MADEYDVIIVGSGAGGGTLAHRLAPSGKRVLILERGDWLPREVENWDATAVFVDNRYVSAGHLVRQGRQGLPAAGPLLRRWRDEVLRGRAVPAAGAGLRRAEAPRRHLAGVADRLRRPRAVLRPGRAASTRCTAPAERTRPTHPAAPYPYPPVSHEPRIQELFDDLAKVGPAPVPLPQRDHARRGEPRLQHLHPLRDLRRLPLPGAREVRRRRDRRPPVAACTTNVTLLRNAAGAAARDRPVGSHRHLGRRGRRRRASSGSPASVVVVSAGAANSAKLLLASANDRHPNGLANGSDQVGRNYIFHNSRAFLAVSKEKNDTRFQKTLGLNDWYLGDDDFEYPMGNVQMVGKSSAPMYRGEKHIAELAPHVRARARWPSTRSTSGSRPRTCPIPTTASPLGKDGNVVLSYTPEQPRAPRAALPPGEEAPQPPRHASRTT